MRKQNGSESHLFYSWFFPIYFWMETTYGQPWWQKLKIWNKENLLLNLASKGVQQPCELHLNSCHCDHVNDFPVVKGTPGIIQDAINLLIAKSNFTNKRWMVLVFSTCNTIHLLLVKLHFVNKRRMVLVFSTCNTVDLLLVKLNLLFLIFY